MTVMNGKLAMQSLGVALVAMALSSLLWFSGTLQGLEAKTWDLRCRLLASPSNFTEDIVLVLVDQQSIDWVHEHLGISWPWPRELHGAIVSQCERRGAKAIGVDVLFTEPSFYGVSDDSRFGAALGQVESLAMGSVSAPSTAGRFVDWPESAPRPNFSVDHSAVVLPSVPRALFPIAEVSGNGGVLCNISQKSDVDGIFRRLQPLVFFAGSPLPTLGIGTYLAAHQQEQLVLTADALQIGSRLIPLDHQGRLHLRFRGTPFHTYRSLSAAPLIEAEILLRDRGQDDTGAHQDLAGKYVFYGFSAPGLMDLRPTPVGGKTPGVELHATTLDNLLANDFFTPLPLARQYLYFLPVFILAGLMMLVCKRLVTLLAVLGLFSLLPLALGGGMYQAGFYMHLVPFGLTLFLSMAGGGLLNYRQEGRQRRFIKHSFKHYLSPHVIEELLEHPEKLQLGGERKEISIFFSDLQGFTSISETLEPEALTSLLNEYLTAMTDIIQAEEGTVDKYEGDAIIAFWNAPISYADHAQRCVRAALKCQQELARLRPQFKEQYGHELHMRIGMNTGDAVVGNFGSASRFDYTMLGDAVNVAARLEGANKQFHTFTMISEATCQRLGSLFPVRELARLQVVGRGEPVTVYEPFLTKDFLAQQDTLSMFAQGLTLFYQGELQQAACQFQAIAGVDSAAGCYLEKCQQLLDQQDLDPDWQGVWSLTVK